MPKKGPAERTADVRSVLAALQSHASRKVREDMSKRYGIFTDKAYGVMMRDMQKVAKSIGTDHAFAQALWETGWYEARMVACMVADPKKVTPAQMDAWCADFDNWGICDTVCFKLWDQVPHAFTKVEKWAKSKDEFVKRAAFALLACLCLHRSDADNKTLLKYLPLIEKGASDERNFVKKGVSWALRSMGQRNAELHAAAVILAERLASSRNVAERWVGKDALRDIKRPMIARRLASRERTEHERKPSPGRA